MVEEESSKAQKKFACILAIDGEKEKELRKSPFPRDRRTFVERTMTPKIQYIYSI